MLRLGRLKACLSRGRCEINVDFRRRHGIRVPKLWHGLVQGWERLRVLAGKAIHTLRRIRVHALAKAKRLGLELRKGLLVLRQQTGRDVRAVCCTQVRIAVVQVEPVKARNGVLEQLRVVLRVQKRRGLVIVEAVVLVQVGRVVRRRRDV